MKISDRQSDSTLLQELGRRLAKYRLNENLTQAALAKEAGISRRTLARIENGESSQISNFIRVLRALDLLENLEALVPQPAPSPIQQLHLKGRARRRASGTARQSESDAPWSWGDDE